MDFVIFSNVRSRLFSFLCDHFSGWVGGSPKGSRSAFIFPTHPPVEKSKPSEAESRQPSMGGWTGFCRCAEQRFFPLCKKKWHITPCSKSVHVQCERARTVSEHAVHAEMSEQSAHSKRPNPHQLIQETSQTIQETSKLLRDVERKTKCTQTTHTLRAQSHWDRIWRLTHTAVALWISISLIKNEEVRRRADTVEVSTLDHADWRWLVESFCDSLHNKSACNGCLFVQL